MAWNVVGELVSPKNMTVGSNSPLFVLNAAFHSSPSLIWTLLLQDYIKYFAKGKGVIVIKMMHLMKEITRIM